MRSKTFVLGSSDALEQYYLRTYIDRSTILQEGHARTMMDIACLTMLRLHTRVDIQGPYGTWGIVTLAEGATFAHGGHPQTMS